MCAPQELGGGDRPSPAAKACVSGGSKLVKKKGWYTPGEQGNQAPASLFGGRCWRVCHVGRTGAALGIGYISHGRAPWPRCLMRAPHAGPNKGRSEIERKKTKGERGKTACAGTGLPVFRVAPPVDSGPKRRIIGASASEHHRRLIITSTHDGAFHHGGKWARGSHGMASRRRTMAIVHGGIMPGAEENVGQGQGTMPARAPPQTGRVASVRNHRICPRGRGSWSPFASIGFSGAMGQGGRANHPLGVCLNSSPQRANALGHAEYDSDRLAPRCGAQRISACGARTPRAGPT